MATVPPLRSEINRDSNENADTGDKGKAERSIAALSYDFVEADSK